MSGFSRLILNLKLKTMDERNEKAMNEELKPQLKQTAVDWLLLNINIAGVSSGSGLNIDEIKEKAKQMEKEQIFDAYITGRLKDKNINYGIEYYNKLDEYIEEGEDYYSKNYEQ